MIDMILQIYSKNTDVTHTIQRLPAVSHLTFHVYNLT